MKLARPPAPSRPEYTRILGSWSSSGYGHDLALDTLARLNMEKSTVSRNVERMRANGWLTVSATDSGHKQQLSLTRQGRKLLQDSVSSWNEAQTRTRALLGRRGSDSIRSLGNTVYSAWEPVLFGYQGDLQPSHEKDRGARRKRAQDSRKVSRLQTWTYSPQKRQDGSAFALT